MKDNIIIDCENAYDVIPFYRKDGSINLLVNIIGLFDKPELLVMDLSGNVVKRLMPFDHSYRCVALDEKNIYTFSYNTLDSKFCVFNKETLDLKYKKILEKSTVQSVYSDGKKLYTLDVARNEAQVRYKNGKIKSSHEFDGNYVDIYFDGKDIKYTDLKEFGINNESLKECKRKYGSEFMELNDGFLDSKLSYDIENKIMYTAKRNIVYCSSKEDGILGIMYFPDQYIRKILFDSLTNSLIVSSHICGDYDKHDISTKYKGRIEIIPASMIQDRIKSSEEFLLNRTINKKFIMDCYKESKGDINKMIIILQELKNAIEKYGEAYTDDCIYQLKITKK